MMACLDGCSQCEWNRSWRGGDWPELLNRSILRSLGREDTTLNFRKIKCMVQRHHFPVTGVLQSFITCSPRTPRELLFCFIGHSIQFIWDWIVLFCFLVPLGSVHKKALMQMEASLPGPSSVCSMKPTRHKNLRGICLYVSKGSKPSGLRAE